MWLVLTGGERVRAEDLGWYDAGWAFRRAVTVSLRGEQSLTDFPVGLTLPDGFDFTKAQPDGADVRVTLDDGITTVPLWIETWSAESARARIWMRLPRIPAGDSTLWLYYGNRDAGPASDGAATFDFFEDFNHPEPTLTVRLEDALNRAVNWLVRAQDVNPGGGVAKFYYTASDKWSTTITRRSRVTSFPPSSIWPRRGTTRNCAGGRSTWRTGKCRCRRRPGVGTG